MMANKIKLKKYLLCTLLIAIVLIGVFLSINIYEYYTYRKDVNNKLTEVINVVAEKYPKVTKKELGAILNTSEQEENKQTENSKILPHLNN